MKTSAYVILTKHGVLSLRKGKPKLNSNEVAVRLNLTISDKFFERFVPEVDIDVPDDYVAKPEIGVELKGGTMDKLLGEDDT